MSLITTGEQRRWLVCRTAVTLLAFGTTGRVSLLTRASEKEVHIFAKVNIPNQCLTLLQSCEDGSGFSATGSIVINH